MLSSSAIFVRFLTRHKPAHKPGPRAVCASIMFSSLMEGLGVMDIIAPMSQSSALILAIQQKNMENSISELHAVGVGRKDFTPAKCGPLHLASQHNFLQFVDYLLANGVCHVGEVDAVRSTSTLVWATPGAVVLDRSPLLCFLFIIFPFQL